MRSKRGRIVTAALLATSGAMVMQSPNFACESFAGESAFGTIDFCFIFDCNSGLFGGTVQFCEEEDAFGNPGEDLLLDCPPPNAG